MKVLEYRKAGSDLFLQPSFDSISSIGSNGAVIHYSPQKGTSKMLNNSEVYLLDSGGQYLDGTTDITRTVHFTEATDFQKDCYTRVLMGNLDIERSCWPKSTKYTGADFDILARRHLLAVGLQFGHGTGHGVGSCLSFTKALLASAAAKLFL
jgi:Xaa-Pro aminopeptidase